MARPCQRDRAGGAPLRHHRCPRPARCGHDGTMKSHPECGTAADGRGAGLVLPVAGHRWLEGAWPPNPRRDPERAPCPARASHA
ncbi:hypothetical protein [Azospirillum largimobile]